MTWVLAKPFVQGYTLIISDICVTVSDLVSGREQYFDCLKKIHDIAPNFGLQVAFAGNVENAFKIIEDMRIFCVSFKKNHPDVYLNVSDFIREWRMDVSSSGKLQFSSDGDDAVHMFIAGTSEYSGTATDVAGFASVYMVKSPDYRPMAVHVFNWHHIGSGSEVEICKQIAEELSKDFRFRLMAIDVSPQEHVSQIVPRVAVLLAKELKAQGISSHLTIGITTFGATEFGIVAQENSSGKPNFPALCTDYLSLRKYLSSKSTSASLIKA